jgi:hypothetical protein
MEICAALVPGAVDAELAMALAERLPESRLVEIGALLRDPSGEIHVRTSRCARTPGFGIPDVVAGLLSTPLPDARIPAGLTPLLDAASAALDRGEVVLIGAADLGGVAPSLLGAAFVPQPITRLTLEREELHDLRRELDQAARSRPSSSP